MKSPSGSYDDLADEYYDATRHPTCANFRTASEALIRDWLIMNGTATVCEVGAGKSLVAPLLSEQGAAATLVLVDSSLRMLRHSSPAVALVVADAAAIPLRDRSVDVLVASLGDPYNVQAFWHEVSRVCAPGAAVLYTTPSHEWATRFRNTGDRHSAEFVTRSGERVLVPSFILHTSDQNSLTGSEGFSTVQTKSLRASELREPLSPKLLESASRDEPIVTAFLLEKGALPTLD